MADRSTGQDCYRPRRSYLVVGLGGAVLSSTLAIVSVVAACRNVDGSLASPLLAATIFGAFWSGMLLLSVWLLLAYFRERLVVDRTAITQHGILRSTSLRIADAHEVTWRRIPRGGSIVIRTDDRALKIFFDNFATTHRDELIAFCHDAFAPGIQHGWTRFAQWRAPSDHRRATSARVGAALCASLLLAIGGIFGYCWLIGFGVACFVIGIANAVVGLWYVWRIWSFRGQPRPAESV